MKKSKMSTVLRQLMEQRKISASKLSRETSVPAATLNSFLHGGKSTKPEHLLALSRFFGISIEQLLFGEIEPQPQFDAALLDRVATEELFEGWVKVRVERAIRVKKKGSSE
ncbi:MAG TPA: helix-turn-helix transcriptional regulator [Bdellovibrionales bacterium]|nr:helix-turn-helix transcriptional regulator [Bdellovibrionales bacterium]